MSFLVLKIHHSNKKKTTSYMLYTVKLQLRQYFFLSETRSILSIQ